jgi:dTDP-4-dehydrorhamnose 3,5-epimerase
MKLTETKLDGVFVIEMEPALDERGFYKRVWGKDDFRALGLDADLDNIGLSYNKKRATFRGIHIQKEPFAESKLVQCIRGKIYDVILDLRENSETFGEWISVELSADDHKAVYIPKGLAHGFQTLEDDSEVLYFISAKYDKDAACGVRWNDERFGIELPLEISVIDERDANYVDFR